MSVNTEISHSSDKATIFGHDLLILDEVSIADLRKAKIKVGFLMMCFCTSGESTFSLSEKEYTLRKGDLFISFTEQILKEGRTSDDFHAKALFMSKAYAQDCIVGLDYLWPYIIYVMTNPVIQLSKEEQSWIMSCHKLICNRLRKGPNRFLRESIVSLTRAFYFEVCGLLDMRVHEHYDAKRNRSYIIFDEFIRRVAQNYTIRREVEWYAGELCISAKHLSEVVKSISGLTAGQWISTFVMVETKTLLHDSTLSIKQIAQQMNFASQSALGKYFKNVTGISPTNYRKNELN